MTDFREGGFFDLPPSSICEQPQKFPSWIGNHEIIDDKKDVKKI